MTRTGRAGSVPPGTASGAGFHVPTTSTQSSSETGGASSTATFTANPSAAQQFSDMRVRTHSPGRPGEANPTRRTRRFSRERVVS